MVSVKNYIWPRVKLYAINLFRAADRFLNALLGGDPLETVSSRVGKLANKAHWAFCFCKVLGFIFRDGRHCQESIRNDVGKDAVIK